MCVLGTVFVLFYGFSEVLSHVFVCLTLMVGFGL